MIVIACHYPKTQAQTHTHDIISQRYVDKDSINKHEKLKNKESESLHALEKKRTSIVYVVLFSRRLNFTSHSYWYGRI